jgi:hypothetical protein
MNRIRRRGDPIDLESHLPLFRGGQRRRGLADGTRKSKKPPRKRI